MSHSSSKSSSFPFCPFSLFLFATSTLAYTKYMMGSCKSSTKKSSDSSDVFRVVFVLGGPGAGKGTQCTILSQKKGWTHLSAGDLLREERKSKSELAEIINTKISAGQIVPSSITVKLIQKAMQQVYRNSNPNSRKTKFLIDGFPRSAENVDVWEEHMPETIAKLEFVLFLHCPEDVMTTRLMERGKTSGRNDDNIETIRKRFKTFRETSMPIVDMFEKKNMLKTIIADKNVQDVYTQVEALFQDDV
mmetsp:Transcript_18391/g.22513  ORF Transcript_18391/g.22513 Transcript_18391/m.22513 type:complete len:247 (-) Transcript_18391:162-902(-)